MQIFSAGIICLLLLNPLLAQEIERDEVILWTPMRWGPMVYVPASKHSYQFVAQMLKDKGTAVNVDCNSEDRFEWFCKGELPVVFEGLDRDGKVTGDVFLCKNGSVDKGKKYYSEGYLAFKCGIIGGWSENFKEPYIEPYEDT